MIEITINEQADANVIIRQINGVKSFAVKVGDTFHESTVWTNSQPQDGDSTWIEFSTVSELIYLLDEAFFWEWNLTNPDEDEEE